ncbi:MAG TPA: dephospho-CoA kinase [Patescibacteria group bacterium]|nr:dephospho-CoA kinase [Patescibacteria group bacterium]
MKTIGLTGGIASGKSTVSRILAEMGAWIIDADQIARDVVAPGTPAWQEITVWMGPEVLLPDASLNRQWLGKHVFADATKRRRLEEITHPRILEQVEQKRRELAAQGAKILVLDVPLLLESGWQTSVQEVWVVYVTPQTQLDRLMQRDGLTQETALQRIRAQMSLEEKAERADRVIDNNGTQEETRRQVLVAWQEVSAENY